MIDATMTNSGPSAGPGRLNRRSFSATYRAFSVAILSGRERIEVERGNKGRHNTIKSLSLWQKKIISVRPGNQKPAT